MAPDGGIGRRTFFKASAGLAAAAFAPAVSAGPIAAPLRLSRGVNLWPWFSLTREHPSPRTDYAWPPFQQDRPVPSSADLKRLAAAGFDFARLPVDPGPFLAAGRTNRRKLMASLRSAVGTTLDAGLSLVVNIQANAATHHWQPQRMLASLKAPAFPAYAALTGEVAAMLAGFDQRRVALEPVNEPIQGCASPAWNDVQAALFRKVRKAAPELTYVACGGCGAMVSGLSALSPKPFLDGGATLFTFHFYEPYLFTHQGAPWMSEPVYRALNDVPWPGKAGSLKATLAAVRARMATDAGRTPAAEDAAYRQTVAVLQQYFDARPDIGFVRGYFAKVDAWRAANGIDARNILLGEFGALRTDKRYVAAPAPDRARYVADVRRTAESFGYPWAFWNLFDGFGLMDESTRRLDPAMIGALGLRNA